ncbi:hypothetical protein HF847_00940 [Clostridium cochlearium]|uniref:restriction endonuclease subunit S n=1 Tax=Clostridium cochlearium TaxID=1494 RepID=UPI0014595FC9|nr:restriction endonuclease subunit S [Clostridium cochlearium]NME94576.1 hypothetical protein [Clostridium cochlearium]
MDTKALKDKILQLAIQGKLVEQDKNDEPASVLLDRIKEEREKLIKEGKIRKPKKLPYIEEEEKPFEIPEGWEWVRLGEVANNHDSKRKPVSVKNRDNLEKIYDYYGATGVIDKVDDFIFDGLYLLIGEDGGNFFNNKDVAFIVQGKFWANNHVHVLDCYSEILTKYVKNVLNSIDFEDRKLITGIAVPKLNQTNLNNILIPLPPLAEQKRIVEKVDQLFALIDELDSNKEDLLEVINLTQNQVLQEAIQGKLVEQNPEDEPVAVLLESIKEEKDKLIKEGKIRKSKKLPPIEEEEKPFEIPEGWEWVRLGEISYNIHYGYTASAKNIDTGVKMLRITDIQDRKVNWGNVPYCEIEDSKIQNYKLKYGDILIARTGGTIGKNFLITDLRSTSVFASYLIRIELSRRILYQYISYFLNSDLYWEQLHDKSKGTGQPNVNTTSLSNLLIPLPPLAEQKRIVEKVDMIMDMLDKLEKELIINI